MALRKLADPITLRFHNPVYKFLKKAAREENMKLGPFVRRFVELSVEKHTRYKQPHPAKLEKVPPKKRSDLSPAKGRANGRGRKLSKVRKKPN